MDDFTTLGTRSSTYGSHGTAYYAVYKAWVSAVRYGGICQDYTERGVFHPDFTCGRGTLSYGVDTSTLKAKIPSTWNTRKWTDAVMNSVYGPQASLSDPPQYIGVKFDYPVSSNYSLWDLISSTAHGPCSWPTIECGHDCQHQQDSKITGM
jgi:hypothetical protein